MKKKSLFIAALALSVSTPAFVQTTEIHAETIAFKDIPASHPHKAKIDLLVEKGVIAGFVDGSFGPTVNVNRGQFASFIARALKLPTPSNPKAFKDVGKQSSVYDGVVKAQAAGIISGYLDGRFRPSDVITRSDMAIMLDRALQYKASFTQKATLTYSDKGSIGNSALAPIQRLSNYKIMGAFKGTSFSPNTHGDRMSTVLSIYQLMVSKNLIAGESVEKEYPAGDLRNYSHAELEGILGKWEVITRSNGDGSISVVDLIADMHEKVLALPDDAPALQAKPEVFFERYKDDLKYAATFYLSSYPKFENTAINGVAYRDTEFYPEFLSNPDPMFLQHTKLNNVIPNPPKENGKMLIDLPSLNKDIVTYHNGKVDVERMSSLVKKTSNGDYLVDVKSLFKDTSIVSVSSDALTIQHKDMELKINVGSDKATLNNKTISLNSSVVSENGVVLVPFKTMADSLGLYWRQMDFAQRFEIANYPLEKDILGWEE